MRTDRPPPPLRVEKAVITFFLGREEFRRIHDREFENTPVEPVISWEPQQRAGPDRRKKSAENIFRPFVSTIAGPYLAVMTRKGAQQEFDGCV